MNLLISLIQNIPLLLIGLLGLGFLVTFHEFGHFIFAKLFNVGTPTFSIGFGPRLYQKKIGDTTFALSAIPLGGYVEVEGNAEMGQGDQQSAHSTGERSFSSKPYWQKFLIMVGGILFNLIFAFLALSYIFFKGAPGIPGNGEMLIGKWATKQAPIISFVSSKLADKVPLHKGDIIKAIDNKPVDSIEAVSKLVREYPDKQVQFTVERAGTTHEIPVTLNSLKTGSDQVGHLSVFWDIAPLSATDSLREGYHSTIDLIKKTANALGSLFSSQGLQQVGGPVMIIHQLKEGASLGVKFFLFLLAFISINLAVLNVIPLPIFDGGQILFFTIEALVGRPLSDATRYKIHYFNWLFVIALVIFLTFKDVTRLTGLDKYFSREKLAELFKSK
jgi:regulator of sigma E protease